MQENWSFPSRSCGPRSGMECAISCCSWLTRGSSEQTRWDSRGLPTRLMKRWSPSSEVYLRTQKQPKAFKKGNEVKVKVAGAAGGEVTGSAYFLQTARAKVLVDAGMFQGGKKSG